MQVFLGDMILYVVTLWVMLKTVLITFQSHIKAQWWILFSALKAWLISLKCHMRGDLVMCVSGSIFTQVTTQEDFSTVFLIELAKKFMHLVNTLFNEVLGKNKEYVFYLYSKQNKFLVNPTFWRNNLFPISGEHRL